MEVTTAESEDVMRIRKCDYATVCSDFDFTCKQHKKYGFFIIIDRKNNRYTRTDDCILKVKNNPDNYEWKNIM